MKTGIALTLICVALAACAVSGPEQLRASSGYAAYNILFEPPTAGGKPAKLWGTIVYNYRIRVY